MDTLEKAMMDQRARPAKIAAAIAVLDRGWGKPTEAVDANVSILDRMTDKEQGPTGHPCAHATRVGQLAIVGVVAELV